MASYAEELFLPILTTCILELFYQFLYVMHDIQPPGGVVEGQVFLVNIPDDFAVGEPRVNVPTGHWKDGTFDLLNAGFCHPSLWCALCFTQGKLDTLAMYMELECFFLMICNFAHILCTLSFKLHFV